jgi:hypothetical protein
MSLGANEELATTEQMRKAVAAWYLNIERGGTTHMELARHSIIQSPKKILRTLSEMQVQPTMQLGDMESQPSSTSLGSAAVAYQSQSGPSCIKVACTRLSYCAFLAVVASLFMWLMSAANEVPPGDCQFDLNGILRASAWTMLLACFTVGWSRRWDILRRVLAFAKTICAVVGVVYVLCSERQSCGEHLYDTCFFLYVTLPLVCFASSCVLWVCTVCVMLGMAESVEAQLGQEQAARPQE